MSKKFLFATILLTLVFSAGAFKTSLNPQNTIASPESPGKFQLVIENEEAVNRTYSISLLSPKSSWFYFPTNAKVPAGENRTLNISISPVKNAIQQRYRFDMTIREKQTGKTREVRGFFQVKQPYRLKITDMSKNREVFRPGEVLKTSVRIKNLDSTPVTNYRMESTYRNCSRTETGTSILPGGERKYEFTFRVAENATPGRRTITHRAFIGEQVEMTAQQEIRVAKVENISKTREVDNRILTLSKTRTARNTGNSASNASLTLSVPSYLSSITFPSSEPDAVQTVNGQRVYTWKKVLEPGQEFSAGYTTKYWIPLLGVVVLTAGIIATKKIGNTVSVRKTAESDGQTVKVRIELTNSSDKSYEELELEEFIPDIATVDETFEMNTPKIRKTNEGTKLHWNLDQLRPGDQRIIQYQITPKVQVEENVELQKAVIKDENGQKLAESNTVSARFTPDTS